MKPVIVVVIKNFVVLNPIAELSDV